MKVALLSDCYLPRLGGIEVQVHDLARALLAAGHEATVITATPAERSTAGRWSSRAAERRSSRRAPQGEPYRDQVREAGLDPPSPSGSGYSTSGGGGGAGLDTPSPSGSGYSTSGGGSGYSTSVEVERLSIPLPGGLPVNPLAPPAVRRLLLDGGYDVAHVHMGVVSPFAMDCMRVCLGIGIPTVVTWHCVLAHTAPVYGALGFARRWSTAGAVLTAVSGVAAEPLRRLAPGAQVGVLPNGIDTARWSPYPRPPRTDDAVRVVTAMRLARRKRPVDVLRVIEQARREAPGTDLRLTVLGEGPWRPRLEHWVRQHDAQAWISLPGRVTRDQLHERYLASDVYVAPAELEAFGLAALEARASGLPVVGPRRSGITEFVRDGVDGLLVADDAEMAGTLARLGRDEQLRENLRAHNMDTPVAQAWPDVVAATVAAYERARGR